jgi:hypothetical protein
VTRKAKLLQQALQSPQNLTFRELCSLAEALGFRQARVKGSHHAFSAPGVVELLNLQDYHGKAKTYQVHQLIKLAEKYGLHLDVKP